MESINDKIQELSEIDLYEVLGVPENATLPQIKKRYNKLVLKYHPDKIKKPTDKTNEKFGLISEAYKILSVDKNRKKYDRFRELISEKTKEYSDLKSSYNEYVKDLTVDKNDPNYEQKKMEGKQDFDKRWEELNNKHGLTTDITPLSTKEADTRLADMIKNRNDGIVVHDNLFEDKKFNVVDFNKAFEEMKKRNIGKELVTGKINAMDTMVPYASVYESNLYVNGADGNANNCAGINEAFNLPSSHITKQDMDNLTSDTDYDTHDKEKLDTKTLEERLREYELMTNNFNNRTLKDYSKDEYGDYGIFDKLLLDKQVKKETTNIVEDEKEDDDVNEIIDEFIDFSKKE